MFKTVVVAALTLVLGLFLGGIGPRTELRNAKKELAEARAAAEEAESSSALPRALGGILGSAAEGAASPRREPPPRFVVPAGTKEAPAEPRDGGARERRPRRDFFKGDDFETARTAAQARSEQFRAAFLEEARLPPEKKTAFDEAVKKMNESLAKEADALAQSLGNRTAKLKPRDMADIAARVLDVYRKADDDLQGILDENGRAAADRTKFDMLTQVDIGAVRKLGETVEALGFDPPGGRP